MAIYFRNVWSEIWGPRKIHFLKSYCWFITKVQSPLVFCRNLNSFYTHILLQIMLLIGEECAYQGWEYLNFYGWCLRPSMCPNCPINTSLNWTPSHFRECIVRDAAWELSIPDCEWHKWNVHNKWHCLGVTGVTCHNVMPMCHVSRSVMSGSQTIFKPITNNSEQTRATLSCGSPSKLPLLNDHFLFRMLVFCV